MKKKNFLIVSILMVAVFFSTVSFGQSGSVQCFSQSGTQSHNANIGLINVSTVQYILFAYSPVGSFSWAGASWSFPSGVVGDFAYNNSSMGLPGNTKTGLFALPGGNLTLSIMCSAQSAGDPSYSAVLVNW